MKKLLFAAALILGFSGMSLAQQSGTQTVNMSLSVYKGLTITSSTNGSFGSTYAGVGSITLTPNSPTAGQSAGTFIVNGDTSHVITVTYSSANPPSSSLTYAPALYGYNANTQGSSTSVSSNTTVTLNPTTGDYYFWVGGTVSGISNSTTPGTYTATFTLTVSY